MDASLSRMADAADPASQVPRYRSGAVARMLRMPVATLRIWERRYALCQPATTPSGHRLYNAAQVRELAQVKQLVDLGHAIGTVAGLDGEARARMLATHVEMLDLEGKTPAQRHPEPPPARPDEALPAPARAGERPLNGHAFIWLENEALAQRLAGWLEAQRAAGHPVVVGGTPAGPSGKPPELPAGATGFLIHEVGTVDAEAVARVLAATQGHPATVKALLYSYAPPKLVEPLLEAGVRLLRGSQPEPVLQLWLDWAWHDRHGALPDADVLAPPRRYDDATLSDMAVASTTVACECPRHVSEILTLLSQFEAYSRQCENLSPEDAALHAMLERVTGQSRALFEGALDRLMQHERKRLEEVSAGA